MAAGTSVKGTNRLVVVWRMPKVHVNTTLLVGVVVTAMGPSTGRRTAAVKLQLLVLPQASCAVITTVLVVLGRNAVPEGGTELTVTLLHVSEARLVGQVTTTGLVSQV